jgi:hypothetical protein
VHTTIAATTREKAPERVTDSTFSMDVHAGEGVSARQRMSSWHPPKCAGRPTKKLLTD